MWSESNFITVEHGEKLYSFFLEFGGSRGDKSGCHSSGCIVLELSVNARDGNGSGLIEDSPQPGTNFFIYLFLQPATIRVGFIVGCWGLGQI